MFDKLLICNRGEIAVRIIRTCRDLGIATVVAHSEADRDSRAVELADESVCLGPGPAAHSYLNVPAILYACARTGAEAVHPGYGFLAEDPYFARVCREAGVTFVGPSEALIELLGDKARARRAMSAAGVPVCSGVDRPLAGLAEARSAAAAIGYPVIVKAVAGGGGRGMAVVPDAESLPAAFADVRRTAGTLFGDDRLYVERYVTAARHVEVQVLGDRHGTVVHLGERDCTIQRRRQKLVEESPSAALGEDLRARICAAAVEGARAVGYHNAGTMEFLVDAEGRFFFMEMNTRIQVEHAVTEMRTGIDLVEWMIRTAAGERLTFAQDQVALSGHVIECRINAEDPSSDWRGSTGTLERFQPPTGPRVRVDTHAFPGYRVSPYYDSLLAKVVAHGRTREEALRVMDRALLEFDCTGVATTIPFHRGLLAHPEFRAGTHQLDFVASRLGPDGRLRVVADGSTPAEAPDLSGEAPEPAAK
ncbi:MAG TPA: acetyl-CoA carboxylase biotin carboxylase subunit [Kineosporiaceae bacterium]|nr:acetyl-CoA carboxylase biotin carboxylase subunit [Kineosporiaceae bacterium]